MFTPIRAFIAIPLTREIHHNIDVFIQNYGLANHDSGFRPVKQENIHLTLKFLGDVEPARIPAISEQLEKLAGTFRSIPITVSGVGAFPDWKKQPRVIWVGVQPVEPLQRIYQALDKVTTALGFPSEHRPFSPHLTLARVKQQAAGPRFNETIKRMMILEPAPSFGEMQASEMVLFKSVLQPAGPVYSILSEHKFNG